MGLSLKNLIIELNTKPWATSLITTFSLILGITRPGLYFLPLPLLALFIKNFPLKHKFVAVIFFAIGYINQIDIKTNQLSPHKPTNKLGLLSGTIVDLSFNRKRIFPFLYKINGQFQKKTGDYLLYTKKDIGMDLGQNIKIDYLKPSTPSKEFRDYLKKEGISSTFFAGTPKVYATHKSNKNINDSIISIKNGVMGRIKNKTSKNCFCLFASIFLGNKKCCAEEYENLKTLFKNWGLSHILARSGLHLLIFIITISSLISLFVSNFYLQQLIQIILLFVYYFLSWPSTSFNRAFIFILLWQMCNILSIQKNSLNLLNLVATITLLINPLLIFFLDFQLSFLFAYALAFLVESNQPFKSNS